MLVEVAKLIFGLVYCSLTIILILLLFYNEITIFCVVLLAWMATSVSLFMISEN